MPYRYDLHAHCIEGSSCSSLSAESLIDLYRDHGYSGFCLTDHFSGSNPLPDNISWDQRVLFFYDIWYRLHALGEQRGLEVFFGLEYSLTPDIDHMSIVSGHDFLLLNITKDWLLVNKEVFSGKPSDLFCAVQEAGGFVIHAHPFLDSKRIEGMHLFPRNVDAVEVTNAARFGSVINDRASAYAKDFDLLEVAASDLHHSSQKILGGIETDEPCWSSEELITAIRECKTRNIIVER